MSKELIEQLRELSAKRKPYVTGAHGQMIGMESYRIVANGFALECIEEAADHIEELERKVASRDAELAKLKDDNEYLYIAAIERDQLREQVKMLRNVLDDKQWEKDGNMHAHNKRVQEALAATEQKP